MHKYHKTIYKNSLTKVWNYLKKKKKKHQNLKKKSGVRIILKILRLILKCLIFTQLKNKINLYL